MNEITFLMSLSYKYDVNLFLSFIFQVDKVCESNLRQLTVYNVIIIFFI